MTYSWRQDFCHCGHRYGTHRYDGSRVELYNHLGACGSNGCTCSAFNHNPEHVSSAKALSPTERREMLTPEGLEFLNAATCGELNRAIRALELAGAPCGMRLGGALERLRPFDDTETALSRVKEHKNVGRKAWRQLLDVLRANGHLIMRPIEPARCSGCAQLAARVLELQGELGEAYTTIDKLKGDTCSKSKTSE